MLKKYAPNLMGMVVLNFLGQHGLFLCIDTSRKVQVSFKTVAAGILQVLQAEMTNM